MEDSLVRGQVTSPITGDPSVRSSGEIRRIVYLAISGSPLLLADTLPLRGRSL